MDEFDKKDLEKLKSLCKLECSEKEDEQLLKNLQAIFNHIDTLQSAHTEGVIGRHNLLECASNVMGEDSITPSLKSEDFLINAPAQVGGMIKVPTIIEFE